MAFEQHAHLQHSVHGAFAISWDRRAVLCSHRNSWHTDKVDFDSCSTTPCGKGLYGNLPNFTSPFCSGFCWPGHYCEVEGTVIPTPCRAGTFFPGEGANNASLCIPCTEGRYQDLTGQSSCLPCVAGSYSASTKSTACSPCPEGGYCPNPSASSLALAFTPCPAGTFNGDSGQLSVEACTSCPAGSFNPSVGQSSSDSCKSCAAGSYTSNESARHRCSPCTSGTFQQEPNATACNM